MKTLKDKAEERIISGRSYREKDVKEFIDDILELLNYDVDEREKYLYDTIKQKVGFY